MNNNYKKLMAQHGGYIPFTVLGGVKTTNRKLTKRRINKRRNVRKLKTKTGGKLKSGGKLKTLRSNTSFMYNANKYAPGTIIRSNGILYHLNNSRQWTKI